MPSICHICANTYGNTLHNVPEMRFGTGERFEYMQCAACGCLQLVNPPANMAAYYPPDYAGFGATPDIGRLKNTLRRLRDRFALTRRGLIGRLLYARYPEPAIFSLRQLALRPNSRILDVGSGGGALLYRLHDLGYRNAHGVDAHLHADITHANGARVQRGTLANVPGGWNLIMFHHSFEHMPLGVLQTVQEQLAPGGTCLIRMPVVPCAAWERYGVCWVQLDAPRHLFIHSAQSLARLAAEAGLEIYTRFDDSTAFQFWGSEQVQRSIALQAPQSYLSNPSGSIFSRRELRTFARTAQRLNAAGRGDQAAFFLRPKK